MDISTLVGLLVAVGGIIAGYLVDKGNLASLFLISPFLIVVVGTIGATIISFGLSDTAQAVKALFKSYVKKNLPDPDKLIKKVCEMADLCRSQGLLQLQSRLNDSDLEGENFLMLKEAMVLATDTKNMETMQETLQADITSYTQKKQLEIDVFTEAGGFSPTLGIIGTVMGLVQVLSNITDANALAKSIATAFIATLYGIFFANVIYLPAANHLKACLKRQLIYRDMIVDGMCMLASGESSRNIENKLALYYHAFPNGEKKYKAGIEN
ncbi:MAG: MotA/TolQ/ExbB proton channel family protein [Oscillospiraceae bacterium]|jgi:chemotaxis protein MotA|nr:MotA/TolQ/ExbB proton channel family protein [Oscillospiraceae bacterium]MCI2034411.1 MotA/TolQ/ExbB proton channel family protein [Oscillospiraceae bacterium]